MLAYLDTKPQCVIFSTDKAKESCILFLLLLLSRMYHWVPVQTHHENMLLALKLAAFWACWSWEAAERPKKWSCGDMWMHVYTFVSHLFYFLHQHFLILSSTAWLVFLFVFFSFRSPWRLCGPQPGPPSRFWPAARSGLFSTRCPRSETCTKASILAWRPGWANTARLSPPQVRRGRWSTRALIWLWETSSWKW